MPKNLADPGLFKSMHFLMKNPPKPGLIGSGIKATTPIYLNHVFREDYGIECEWAVSNHVTRPRKHKRL
jgi:hypothetical protein